MNKQARIFVAGHRGLVGSALVRRLTREGFTNLLTATRDQLDLRDQAAVNYWFRANRPSQVYLVAGTVGGEPALADDLLLGDGKRACEDGTSEARSRIAGRETSV